MDVISVTDDAEEFTANAFLVPGSPTTLVDVGIWDGIVDAVRTHVDAVDRVVLTHQHPDHVGELDAVLDAFDADCYAYAAHPSRTHSLADGDEVAIGPETFEVVHTPGHADDHVSLVSESTLFAGDTVVHDDGAFTGGSFGRTDNPDQSREVLIESIEDLLDRMPSGVEHMYSGHGGEFHGDVRSIVETSLARAERHEPKYPDE
jgi:hydroxyacylglutathione hydrolase